jgi:hypothetical protein
MFLPIKQNNLLLIRQFELNVEQARHNLAKHAKGLAAAAHPFLLLALDQKSAMVGERLLADWSRQYETNALEQVYLNNQTIVPFQEAFASRTALFKVNQQNSKWYFNSLMPEQFPSSLVNSAGLDEEQSSLGLRLIIDRLRNKFVNETILPESVQHVASLDRNTVYVTIIADLSNPQSRESLPELLARLAMAHVPDYQTGLPPMLKILPILFLPNTAEAIRQWQAHLNADTDPVKNNLSQVYDFMSHAAYIFAANLAKVGITNEIFRLETFLVDDVREDNTRLGVTNQVQAVALLLRQFVFSPVLNALEREDLHQNEVTDFQENSQTSSHLPKVHFNLRLFGVAEAELLTLEAFEVLLKRNLGWLVEQWLNPSGVDTTLAKEQGRNLATDLLERQAELVQEKLNLDFDLPKLNELRYATPSDTLKLWEVKAPLPIIVTPPVMTRVLSGTIYPTNLENTPAC